MNVSIEQDTEVNKENKENKEDKENKENRKKDWFRFRIWEMILLVVLVAVAVFFGLNYERDKTTKEMQAFQEEIDNGIGEVVEE